MTEIPAGIWFRLICVFYKLLRNINSFLSPVVGKTPSLSWDEYDIAIKILAYRSSRFNPDVIVGIGVGGAITAATLAGNMNKRFISIEREVEWNSSREIKILDASVTSTRKQLFDGKRILIVSAEIISGQSTKLVIDYITKLKPNSFKVACIDFHPNSATYVTPDYYYISTNNIIQKPWRLLPSYNCPDDNQRPN